MREANDENGVVNLISRILTRSGELTFDAELDAAGCGSVDHRYRWLEEWIGKDMSGARVVDVGCWTGDLLAWARSAGAVGTVGVDLDGPWLDVARGRPEVDEVEAGSLLEGIPSRLHGAFDVVFFLETLEHLPRGTESAALTVLSSLLAPGGYLYASTPLAGIAALADPAWYLVGHRHYRTATLVGLAENAGLVVEETRFSGNLRTSVETCCFYLNKHLRWRKRTGKQVARVSTGDQGLQRVRGLTSTNVWIRAAGPGARKNDSSAESEQGGI